jgi:protein-tyrosine-phosphatase
MAEGMLRHRLAEDGWSAQVEVESAGTWGLDGSRASRYSREVMADRGMSIDGHRARSLRAEDVRAADLILVMEGAHLRSVLAGYPSALDKVSLLTEIADREGDVEDPYGQPRPAYEVCADLLQTILAEGYAEILSRLGLLAPDQ